MNKHPICVASKGRANDSKTLTALFENGSVVHLFVEPQDADKYQGCYPNADLHVLPENDKGISFVRNFILNFARIQGWDWYWMLDDDISNTYEVINKRCVKIPLNEALSKAEPLITGEPQVAIGSLEYQQYAWSAAKPKKYNSYCDVAVLISVSATKYFNYRDHCKEDRDFVLQALSLGWRSMRTCWIGFSVPKNGSNKGGLFDAYASGLETHWSSAMVGMWPGICALNTKPDGRPDVKVNWKHFAIK